MNTRNFLVFILFMEVFDIANNKDNLINEQIKVREMMVIGPNGEQLGIKSKQDALTLAKSAGFDLVLMSENATPAVCKIMDYNKFKYERNKKMKEAQKKQRIANVDIICPIVSLLSVRKLQSFIPQNPPVTVLFV